MHDPKHTPPRWLRWTVAVVATLLVCAGFGATTARAELSLGPHQALYEVTGDPHLVVDLGPLGRIVSSSPLPLGLGVTVTVKEIPADLTAVDAPRTLDAMSRDLDAYLQFFDSPGQTIDTASRALVEDAVIRTLVAFGVVVLFCFAVREALGAQRRGELAARIAPRTWQLTGAAVLVVFVWATSTGSVPERRTTEPAEASMVFAGTPLEGATLTGRLARVIDTYSGQLAGLYRNNSGYYTVARENLEAAWDEADAREVAPPPPDTLTVLLISDLHCNTGMTPLVRTAAVRSGAGLVLNAGDTTINGTDVENVCVDSFATAVPDDVPFVVSDGNHDSVLTSAAERRQGQIVLDGEIVEAAGLRILGDRDPLETRIGGGTTAIREETPAEAGRRLRDVACEARDAGERIDVLLVHTPAVGDAGLRSGCVPFQLSGHMHQRIGPDAIGYGLRYVNSTTGGASLGKLSVGPLQYPAAMTVLRFDTVSRSFTQLREIVVEPDQSVTVGDWESMPPAWPIPGTEPVRPGEPR
ncbi:metallophosphoesterase family protein [Myceligenerans pegani]|uniref:Metallophosphoesterase family protein n=1 Tax=Myceligenerans pegani TaxID=2776917 RepID=A0ABR9N367_9MICO|nr:metallophosphoesterase [Myceligenerans sp. TRM 65318]MBE1877721.1 metallophosphoesterase family protein [Myceligenerans sp. TRM 65318]MBE3019992.1 metallophosphoesterase family protein [Myceligenerans sp. TRM 65318]